jgi:hypothetical protein
MAGIRPSGKGGKTREEMETVMKCKIEGLTNLIESAKLNDFHLGSLILCSSLSAISGMSAIEGILTIRRIISRRIGLFDKILIVKVKRVD